MADSRPIAELSYKEASDELEGIVRSLEQGDLELEDSLERYARGVELLKSLKSRLTEAEQKVQVLLDAAAGDTAAPAASAVPQAPVAPPVGSAPAAPSQDIPF